MASQPKEESIPVCYICDGKYIKLRKTPCDNNFCTDCVNLLTEEDYFSCPCCQQKHLSSDCEEIHVQIPLSDISSLDEFVEAALQELSCEQLESSLEEIEKLLKEQTTNYEVGQKRNKDLNKQGIKLVKEFKKLESSLNKYILQIESMKARLQKLQRENEKIMKETSFKSRTLQDLVNIDREQKRKIEATTKELQELNLNGDFDAHVRCFSAVNCKGSNVEQQEVKKKYKAKSKCLKKLKSLNADIQRDINKKVKRVESLKARYGILLLQTEDIKRKLKDLNIQRADTKKEWEAKRRGLVVLIQDAKSLLEELVDMRIEIKKLCVKKDILLRIIIGKLSETEEEEK